MNRSSWLTASSLVLCLVSPLSGQARPKGQGVGPIRVGGGAGVGAGVGVTDVGVRADTNARGGANAGGRGLGVDVMGRESVSARAQTMERERPNHVLTDNTHLAGRLQTMLPAGQTTEGTATGFKNTGQFVAAVHAANNLSIPFDQLKAKMTGSEKLSLGKSIQQLKPDADSKAEEKKAKKQAQADLEASAEAALKAQSEVQSRK